jgi:hypothetical protein
MCLWLRHCICVTVHVSFCCVTCRQGHKLGASQHLEKCRSLSNSGSPTAASWKMSQFKDVPSKVAPTFRGDA